MELKQRVDSICLDTTLFLTIQKPKSRGTIGNITIDFNKKFNWLQRKMWKLCFGLEITNLK